MSILEVAGCGSDDGCSGCDLCWSGQTRMTNATTVETRSALSFCAKSILIGVMKESRLKYIYSGVGNRRGKGERKLIKGKLLFRPQADILIA